MNETRTTVAISIEYQGLKKSKKQVVLIEWPQATRVEWRKATKGVPEIFFRLFLLK